MVTATRPELKTRDVTGIELLKVGKWQGHGCPKGGCEFTAAKLDGIVSAYDATKDALQAPVKLGHNDDQNLLAADGFPAAGWVTNLRRDGDRLLGDFEKVPNAVADLMAAGAYRTRSAEFLQDHEIEGEKYPLVLTGVALLGEDLPAVQGLSDITALYHSLHLSLDDVEQAIVFTDGSTEDDTDLAAELEVFLERMDSRMKGQKGMPAMRAFLRETTGKLRALQNKRSPREELTVDEKEVRQVLGLDDNGDILATITALKAKTAPTLEEVEALKTELSQATARLLTIEGQRADEQADAKVNACIRLGQLIPAQKDVAKRMYLRSSEDFEAFVAAQPRRLEFGERGVETDETAIALTAAETKAAAALGLSTEDMIASKQRQREKVGV